MHEQNLTIRLFSPRNLLAILAGLGLYMGISLANPALVLIGTASLTALGFNLWQLSRLMRSLKAGRLHPSRSFEGQHVIVTLRIVNNGSVSQSLILLEDNFPPGDVWRIRHLIEHPIERDERLEIHYTGTCSRHRGLYTLGPLKFESCDALGLFRRELILEEFTFLLVYPNAVELSMTQVLADGTLAHVGMETLPQSGNSTEFTGLRDWRPGDPPNLIHWRSTARAGELIVKEFQDQITTEVSFFLDLGRMGLTGLGDQTSVEYAIKATASLARRAIEKAHAVQMYAVGQEVEYTPFGTGNRHLLMILDHLALMKVTGDTHFLATVRHYIPYLRPGGTVFLVVSATAIELEDVIGVVGLMRQKRLFPILVLIDDRAFIKLYREQETRHIEAIGLEELACRLTLEGARVHIVTKAKSQKQALLRGLEEEFLAHD